MVRLILAPLTQEEKSNGHAKPQPRVPQPKARVVPPPPAAKGRDDYLGDVDLPSASSSESEDEEPHKPMYTAEEKEGRVLNSMVITQIKLQSARGPGMHKHLMARHQTAA